jgi:DNA-binding NarL/FixJ family response regulator
VERAHHAERAAGMGDEEAIGLLEAAAAELRSPAPWTIEAHLRNIYHKLDVRSRIELAQKVPSATNS